MLHHAACQLMFLLVDVCCIWVRVKHALHLSKRLDNISCQWSAALRSAELLMCRREHTVLDH